MSGIRSSTPPPVAALPAAPSLLPDELELAADLLTAHWWGFDAPRAVLAAERPDQVPALLDRVERETSGDGTGRLETGATTWAVGFVAYEAAPAFDPALAAHPLPAGVPAAWFALFDHPRSLPAPPSVPGPVLAGSPAPSIEPGPYGRGVEAVHDAIARGDSYQANLTYRLRAPLASDATPWQLFGRLVEHQPSPHACFLHLTDRPLALCSASPELFFRRHPERIVCRPMKGTARRGRTAAEDLRAAEELAGSAKERAENVMILDMVRNDLGYLVEPSRGGSVVTTEICRVERYPTVLQMVSEAEARFRPEDRPGLAEIFAALFPYASITGAPKISTSHLLARLETTARGAYTGAIGVVAPGGGARFSVAIRTATVHGVAHQPGPRQAASDNGAPWVEYGTGGGIVWDSTIPGELAESRDKAIIFERLAHPAEPPFELLETLAWFPPSPPERAPGCRPPGFVLLERHLERLARSLDFFAPDASHLPTEAPVEAIVTAARAHLAELHDRLVAERHGASRVRLLVGLDGSLRSEHGPLEARPRDRRTRLIALCPWPVDSGDRDLFHKTTRRELYHRALADTRAALASEDEHPNGGNGPIDDALLWSATGGLTESTLANLVLRLDGGLVTPPVEVGLLPGTLREELLSRRRIVERRIGLEDLQRSEAIFLINSVRGWMPARWTGPSPSETPDVPEPAAAQREGQAGAAGSRPRDEPLHSPAPDHPPGTRR